LGVEDGGRDQPRFLVNEFDVLIARVQDLGAAGVAQQFPQRRQVRNGERIDAGDAGVIRDLNQTELSAVGAFA
jgi:hypothetical protein